GGGRAPRARSNPRARPKDLGRSSGGGPRARCQSSIPRRGPRAYLGPAELVRRCSRPWRRRLPRVIPSAGRHEPLLPALDLGGPVPLLRRSRPLHPGGRRGGPRCGRRGGPCSSSSAPAATEGGVVVVVREGSAAAGSSSHAGMGRVERRCGWRRRQGIGHASSLRGEASGSAAFLRQRASRPAARRAAAGGRLPSPHP
ncbi:unnamed protein product, partial [Urochloa humidicola]